MWMTNGGRHRTTRDRFHQDYRQRQLPKDGRYIDSRTSATTITSRLRPTGHNLRDTGGRSERRLTALSLPGRIDGVSSQKRPVSSKAELRQWQWQVVYNLRDTDPEELVTIVPDVPCAWQSWSSWLVSVLLPQDSRSLRYLVREITLWHFDIHRYNKNKHRKLHRKINF